MGHKYAAKTILTQLLKSDALTKRKQFQICMTECILFKGFL